MGQSKNNKKNELIHTGYINGRWFINEYNSFNFLPNEKSGTNPKSRKEERQKIVSFITRFESNLKSTKKNEKDEAKFDFCKEYIEFDNMVVDISAAPGTFNVNAVNLDLVKRENLICTEFSREFCDELKRVTDLCWRVLDLSSKAKVRSFFSNLNKKVDLWIVWHSSYYCPDVANFFDLIANFSAASAKIIITGPNPKLGTILNFRKEVNHPTNFLSCEEISMHLEERGFEIVKECSTQKKFSIRPDGNAPFIKFWLRWSWDLFGFSLYYIINILRLKSDIKTFSLYSSDFKIVAKLKNK